jgi:hypothetical protein
MVGKCRPFLGCGGKEFPQRNRSGRSEKNEARIGDPSYKGDHEP